MAVDVAALQRQHPEWGIVDAITAPNGGIWALGRDGGVFALNAEGGRDGVVAPFFDSYNTHPEWGAGSTDRYFTKIDVDTATGGYTLTSNRNEKYNFVGDRPIEQAVTTTDVAEPTKPIEFSDADLASLDADLRGLGLGDLVGRAWGYYKDPQGGASDVAATMRWIEDQPEYRDRFPGLAELRQQGRAWTPGQWTTYYNTVQEAATAAGLPPGMVDRADVGKMIVGNVSPNEAVGRIEAAGASVYNADPAVIGKMREWGFTDGDLTAFYLDPDKAEPLLVKKAKEEQARISVAGAGYGYDINLGEAQQLQKWGTTEAEAQEGFATLGQFHPLFAATVGETMAGEEITEEEQLAAQFGGSGEAQKEISTRKSRRAAAFQGGGGAAGGGRGRTGLG